MSVTERGCAGLGRLTLDGPGRPVQNREMAHVDEPRVTRTVPATASASRADATDVSESPDPEMAGLGELQCGARRDGYICTRRCGHANEHRGHGTAGTVLYAWGYERLAPVAEVNAELLAALKELHALVRGECPSLLNEDSGGDARLDLAIEAAIRQAEAIGQ